MADTWTTVSESDLLTVVSGAELSAYRAAALAEAQGDPVAAVLLAAVNECRGRIAAHASNRLASGATIPAALLPHCLVLARQRVFSRLPVKISQARQDEYTEAQSYLRDVAKGLVAIDQPVEQSDTQAGGVVRPRFTARPKANYGV